MTAPEQQAELVRSLVELSRREELYDALTAGLGMTFLVAAPLCWLTWVSVSSRAAGWPLFLMGVVLLVGGGWRFQVNRLDRQSLPEVLREAPHLIEEHRLSDAALLESSFRFLRFIDGSMVVLGLLLATRQKRLRGTGIGLWVVSACCLALDVLAYERAELRLKLLTQLVQTIPDR